MINLRIISAGKYLPQKVLTNFDLEKMVETSDEWIVTRTGIRERRIAGTDEASSDLGAKALMDAAEKIGFDLNLLDALIVATGTPDRLFPSTAARIHKLLNLPKSCASFDVLAACAGFSYGLEIARSFAHLGYKYIALVGTEVLSKFVDWSDRTTCVLFGDGAGAVIFESTREPGIIYGKLYAFGAMDELLEIRGGGSLLPCGKGKPSDYKIRMVGREVFKNAVTELSDALKGALMESGVSSGEIEAIFSHQANIRIINAVLERAGIPLEKSINNIEKVGNTSSASIPILLSEAFDENRLTKNKIYAFLSFGAGLVWGVHLYKHL